MLEGYHKIKKFLYLILFIILAITFFTKSNYKNAEIINPSVLNEPIQEETASRDIIQFTKNDYEYSLTPLYNYEINALVVRKMDYTKFSIYKMDSVFPRDLCVVWGSNVSNKIYQDKSLKFSQDMRFCFARWEGNLDFNTSEVSNNHLVIQDKEIEKKVKKISIGDQVKIRGKLVDVEAKNVGNPGEYDPEYFTLKSSITREDTTAGACEIIYIESVEILQKGNPVSYNLFKISFYGLVVLLILNIILIFIKLRPKQF